MRVTANSFPTSLLNQLTQLNARQSRLQNQAATGQRVQLPEDDPVAMRRVMDLQAETNSIAQYQRNLDRQQELADASFSAINSLKKISDRAREIATLADDLSSTEESAAYAKEVSELIKQAVQVANTQNRGDYLFAGTRTDQPPFVLTTDANGVPTGYTYQGNASQAETEIVSGVTLTAQAVGANDSGAGPRGLLSDTRVGADFLNHLISLQNHLLAGDTDAIAATDGDQLAKDEDNFLYHISTNGAIQERIETTKSIASKRAGSIEALVSDEVDADLAETLVRLRQTQAAYQAALQTAGSILNRSLMDYLQ